MVTHRRLLSSLSMIVIFTLLFSGLALPPASAQGPDGIERRVNAQTGKVSFLGAQNGPVLSADKALGLSSGTRPQDPAMALAKRFGPEFGLKNPERDLSQIKSSRAQDGRITARYQQNYEGIPVMGGELIVNTNDNGDLYSINGEVSLDLSLSTQPAITSEQARQTALQAVAKWYGTSAQALITTEPALWVYDESLLRPSTRPVELVWRMDVGPVDSTMPVRELVLVNARRGSISLHFNQIDTAWVTPEKTASSTVANSAAQLGATWYVATTGNDSNSCLSAGSPCATIVAALGKAAAGDTIRVATGTYTGVGTLGILIEKNITLSGGWNNTFTTQTGQSTIDGQGVRHGITVNQTVTAVIARFIIQNGLAEYSGAGIYNGGTLTLNNSLVRNNVCCTHTNGNGGAGIGNWGTLTVNNSTIVDNNALWPGPSSYAGGGIYSYEGMLTVNNSTVSGNVAGIGGGIFSFSTVVLNNSTIHRNTASGFGGGITFDPDYLGNPSYTFTIRNTIVAGNFTAFDQPDCRGPITSAGYNLLGINTGCTFSAATGDKVGTSASPIDPRLTALTNNGGPTFTHALITGSPATDAGNTAAPGSGGNACLATDQRGVTRPAGARCDIGAFEGSVAWNYAPLVSTYTANHGTALPGSLVCTQADPNCASGDTHAKAAHKYAIGTYNLYATQHSRNSINNAGMRIISSVHYDAGYENAFWNGDQMVYGDAFGYPLADDVVGHELTHGVTQYESNLFYYYQSGAINESFSDLWGEYYDQNNNFGNDDSTAEWQIGEDVSGQGALRSMKSPLAFGDPDMISSLNYYEGEEDGGGVHTNSGINNKAVYLMVDGGIFNGKIVTPLGWDKVAAIYYHVNTNLLTSGADYSDLYFALQSACSSLIGQKGITSATCVDVKDAIDAVEMNGQPATNFNTDAPLCGAGTGLNVVFADNLEGGLANWTFANGTSPRWQLDSGFYGPYAQSGLHSLYADDYPDVVTNATARLKPLAIPANAYLHFAQAYGFESGYNSGDATFYHFDGGVLEYSINNGTSWSDAGPLIEVNGYDGVLFTGAGNPLSGRSAFAGDSHGYISTRLNLASLAGKTVSFRWRMGLDEAGYDSGWWVDNVRLYTCQPLPGAFSKTAPANGATNQAASLTLSWAGSAGATSYQFCYDTTNDNACANWTNNGTSTSKTLSGLSLKTTYYWHVRAINSGGTTYANGGPTAFWSFRTLDPPGAFNRVSPANGSNGVSLNPTLSWGSSSFASSYQYCYDIINDNQCNRAWVSVPGTSTSITNLGPNTTYYWQVRALNAAGTTEANSSSWGSFTTTSTLPAGTTGVNVFVGTGKQGSFSLGSGQSLRESFVGVSNGPAKIQSTNAIPLIGAERVIYKVGGINTSFIELMGLPDNQVDTTYWLPWYNNVDLDTQLRIANVSNANATVHIFVGTTEVTPVQGVTLLVGESTRLSYIGVNNGPVKIVSTQNIVATERVLYKVAGVNTSYSEMTALPDSQLDTTYWLPWYNNVDLDTQLRIANVSNTDAKVHIFIGNTEVTAAEGIPLQAGASQRLSYSGVNDGPVKIVSDQNIVAAERVVYRVAGKQTSFTEMMALPNSQLDTVYWLPWYNNVDLDTQLRFANTTEQVATVHIFIGGVEQGTGFTLQPGESTRQSFAGINAGPVRIESDQPIVAAERVIYKVAGVNTSFTEMMALPDIHLDTIYWFPWYNNVDLDTQLRFGMP